MFLPAVERIGNTVRKTGTPFIFFPKGLGNGIKDMNVQIANAVSIDWQMDIAEVRKQVGPVLCLQGNLDPRMLLGSKEALKKHLETYIEFGSTETRWIFNLGHGVLPSTPFENAKFAIDWVKTVDWKRS